MDPTHVTRRPRGLGARVATGAAAAMVLVVLVVGPPWALVRFVGWPLPTQVPTVTEIVAAVSQPPGTALVLGVLACVCWLAWAAFTLDVALAISAAILDATTTPRRNRHGSGGAAAQRVLPAGRGPVWRPGAALVGIVLVALLAGSRPTAPAGSSAPPVPAALVHPTSPDHRPGDTGDDAAPGSGWVTVRGPAHGVHDSLWRIADRELHDPTRWPEVYQLNAGQPQADGRALHEPDLIQPRWQLRLPTTPAAAGATSSGSATPSTATPPLPVAPAPGPSARVPAPPDSAGTSGDRLSGQETTGAALPSAPGAAVAEDPQWIQVGPSVAISAAFGAVIAAALAVALRRHARRRRDGSVDTEETFPVLPVVREIAWRAPVRRPAQQPSARTDGDAGHVEGRPRQVRGGHVEHVPGGPVEDDPSMIPHPRTDPTLPARRPDSANRPEPMLSPVWAAALGAARSGGGIGLAGRGAYPALRALLLELVFTESLHHTGPEDASRNGDLAPLAVSGTGWEVVVCEDLPERLGIDPEQLRQLGVILTDLPPTTVRHWHTTAERPVIVLGLVPEPAPTTPVGPSAAADVRDGVLVLAGAWPDGVTAYVSADGTIVAAGPTAHAGLVGRHLPALDVHTTIELLDLAAHAANDPDSEESRGSYDIGADDAAPPAPGAENSVARTGEADPLGIATPDRSERDEPRALATNSDRAPDSIAAAAPFAAEDPKPYPPVSAMWTLTILGPVTLHGYSANPTETPTTGTGPTTGAAPPTGEMPTLSARMRDLLVYLAMHPNGVRRDAIVAALWPDTGRTRPGNNLSSLIGRLNTALRPATAQDLHSDGREEYGRIVIADGDRCRIDNELVDVDYWTFLAITTASVARSASDDAALTPDVFAALRHAHNLYGGPLGEDIDHDWILSIREATRRTYLATTACLVRHHVSTQPATALHILETARNLEPLNEALYRDIIALQTRIGDNDGAAATATLLQSLLTDAEQDAEPATTAVVQHASSRQNLQG